ncbi:MAG: 3-dehydroquinate synthase [Planctomycetota bacterium]|nr:MAG: 3-dehydroquinate synthase [Planctomycetota bacterium]
MQSISVQSAQGQYDIHVGDALLQGVGAGVVKKIPKARVAMLVVDHAVEQTWAREVAASLAAAGLRLVTHVVVASEDNKSIAQVEKVWRCMLAERVQRSDVLCAMGGGIVGDMAAFAASTYMRGIATVMIPTTLLAMVDAAIGGKSAVNLPMASDAPDASVNSGGAKNSPQSLPTNLTNNVNNNLTKNVNNNLSNNLAKNMAGTICAPAWVVSDVRTLSTLSTREFRCGLAECVKHALLADEPMLSWLEKHREGLRAMDPARLVELVHRSASVKAAIVSRDEQEHGERAHLNLGHTFAHAIESLLHDQVHHGEAVSIGLVAMAAASQAAGWWPDADKFQLSKRLADLGLPIKVPTVVDRTQLKNAMKLDKKGQSGAIRLVLLKGLGRPGVLDAASEHVIHAGLDAIGA